MTTIVDYASLVQSIADFQVRADLGTYADYFIQSAEDDIYNDIFALNQGRGVTALEAPFSGAVTNGALALPSSYLGLRYATVAVGGGTYPLQRRTAEFIYAKYPQQSPTGAPAFIGRVGTNFIFGPYPDAAYTIAGVYWMRSAVLSATNPTTWMITEIPTALFAAVMANVGKFLQDPQLAGYWDGDYQKKLSAYISRDKAEEYSGSELMMQVD